jgi:hypothetical protein
MGPRRQPNFRAGLVGTAILLFFSLIALAHSLTSRLDDRLRTLRRPTSGSQTDRRAATGQVTALTKYQRARSRKLMFLRKSVEEFARGGERV